MELCSSNISFVERRLIAASRDANRFLVFAPSLTYVSPVLDSVALRCNGCVDKRAGTLTVRHLPNA
jgi:hypothetical protein